MDGLRENIEISENSNQNFPTIFSENSYKGVALWSGLVSVKDIPHRRSKAIEFADRVMAKYYEIEEKIFKLNTIKATQFLVDTLKEVIAFLEADSVREADEGG